MISWLLRNSLAFVVTPSEIERARTWIYQTAWAQALTQAHAQGYRQGFVEGCDAVSMAHLKRNA